MVAILDNFHIPYKAVILLGVTLVEQKDYVKIILAITADRFSVARYSLLPR